MDEKPFYLSKEVLKVLSVETRVEILKALNERQMTESELSRKLNKHVTTIDEHLNCLKETGLVERIETAGKKWIYYKLTSHGKSIIQPKSYTNIVLLLSVALIAIITGWFLLPALFNVSGTGAGTPTGTVLDYGTLILMITDKFDLSNVSSINITIEAVDAHKTGADWVTVVNDSKTFNLVEIIGVEEFLGESNLTLGNYTQIRLVISNASLTINDTEHDLKIPSEEIKLVHPFTIEANKTTTLTLDFVAADSIVEQEKSYSLKPTIKIIDEATKSQSIGLKVIDIPERMPNIK